MKERDLSILAGRSTILKFPSDAVLSRQGEKSTEIMFVVKGRVRVILLSLLIINDMYFFIRLLKD